jgi:catechol 2,3-dioxygenase-like lactoylglutathione lyase family enzyme
MARIRHIALVTDDPAKTAEFYKQHFGLTELYRRPGDTGEKGVWLSDGYIYSRF